MLKSEERVLVIYSLIASEGENPISILCMSSVYIVSGFLIEVCCDRVLPLIILPEFSILILSNELVTFFSKPINLLPSTSPPPYSLISNISAGTPKQFINALIPRSVPLDFKSKGRLWYIRL